VGHRVAGRLLEALVVTVLLLNLALVLAVSASLVGSWPQWTRPVDLAVLAAHPPAAHPPAPAADADAARGDACARIEELFRGFEARLAKHGLSAPVGIQERSRLLADTSCLLEDPGVQALLEHYYDVWRQAGLEPPPLLPHLED